MKKHVPLVIHGWTVFGHPLFLAQLEALTKQVEVLREKDPVGYVKKNASKRLAAITKLAFDVVPQDPARPEYRQGNTLGGEHKHWFRAKFFQQYRLFFRYHAPSKLIVFAWVNDEDTKRANESGDDAYRCFARCWREVILPMTGISCWPKPGAKGNVCSMSLLPRHYELTPIPEKEKPLTNRRLMRERLVESTSASYLDDALVDTGAK